MSKINKCPNCGNSRFIEGIFRTLIPTQITNEISVIGISVDIYDDREIYAIRTKVCTNCGYTIPYVPLAPKQIGEFIPNFGEVLDHRTFRVVFNQSFSNLVKEGFKIEVVPGDKFDISNINIHIMNKNELIFTTTNDIQKDQKIYLYYYPIQGSPIISNHGIILQKINGLLINNMLGGNYIIINKCFAEANGKIIHVHLDRYIPLILTNEQKSRFTLRKTTASNEIHFLDVIPIVHGKNPFTNEIKCIIQKDSDALIWSDNNVALLCYERPDIYKEDIKDIDEVYILNNQNVPIDCTNIPNIKKRIAALQVISTSTQSVILATDINTEQIKAVINNKVECSTDGFNNVAEISFVILPLDEQTSPGYLLIKINGLTENTNYKFRLHFDKNKTKVFAEYSQEANIVTKQPAKPILNCLSIYPDMTDPDYNTWDCLLSWDNLEKEFTKAKILYRKKGESNFKEYYVIYPDSERNNCEFTGMILNKEYEFKIVEYINDTKIESEIITIKPTVTKLKLRVKPLSPSRAELEWYSLDSTFIDYVSNVHFKVGSISVFNIFNTEGEIIDKTIYIAKHMVTGKKYTFKIIAHDANGRYAMSNECEITLRSNPPSLYASFYKRDYNNDSIFNMSWSDIKGFEKAYLLYKNMHRNASSATKEYNTNPANPSLYIVEGQRNTQVTIKQGESRNYKLRVEGGENEGISNEVNLQAMIDYKVKAQLVSEPTQTEAKVKFVSTNFNLCNTGKCDYQIVLGEIKSGENVDFNGNTSWPPNGYEILNVYTSSFHGYKYKVDYSVDNALSITLTGLQAGNLYCVGIRCKILNDPICTSPPKVFDSIIFDAAFVGAIKANNVILSTKYDKSDNNISGSTSINFRKELPMNKAYKLTAIVCYYSPYGPEWSSPMPITDDIKKLDDYIIKDGDGLIGDNKLIVKDKYRYKYSNDILIKTSSVNTMLKGHEGAIITAAGLYSKKGDVLDFECVRAYTNVCKQPVNTEKQLIIKVSNVARTSAHIDFERIPIGNLKADEIKLRVLYDFKDGAWSQGFDGTEITGGFVPVTKYLNSGIDVKNLKPGTVYRIKGYTKYYNNNCTSPNSNMLEGEIENRKVTFTTLGTKTEHMINISCRSLDNETVEYTLTGNDFENVTLLKVYYKESREESYTNIDDLHKLTSSFPYIGTRDRLKPGGRYTFIVQCNWNNNDNKLERCFINLDGEIEPDEPDPPKDKKRIRFDTRNLDGSTFKDDIEEMLIALDDDNQGRSKAGCFRCDGNNYINGIQTNYSYLDAPDNWGPLSADYVPSRTRNTFPTFADLSELEYRMEREFDQYKALWLESGRYDYNHKYISFNKVDSCIRSSSVYPTFENHVDKQARYNYNGYSGNVVVTWGQSVFMFNYITNNPKSDEYIISKAGRYWWSVSGTVYKE